MNKKTKITIIFFVAGILFGVYLIISGWKNPLSQEQIEKCKMFYALNKEIYTYNKCYRLLKMEVGVLEGVLRK